ncbi:MAG: hypothetical protein ACRD9W_06365, partial [Terriglobia bacterium]
TLTAWITAVQRISTVRQSARREHVGRARAASETPTPSRLIGDAPAPRPIVTGDSSRAGV